MTGIIELDLFLSFFKLGLFTFGGGASMIPLLQQEVLSKGWLEEADLLRYIAISESTPGPIAINMATFVGSTQGGFLGALCATAGVVLPSFIIILIIASMFRKFSEYRGVRAVLTSIRPIVVGMIMAAGALLLFSAVGIKGISDPMPDLLNVILVALIALAMFGYHKLTGKNLSVIQLILISAVFGIGAFLITSMIG